MRHGKVIFLLAVAVIISGCVDLASVFGGNVVKISTETKEEGFRDILVIKDIKTIPTSPVLPAQQVLLAFVIENRDNEKVARDVRAEVFDPSAFRIIGHDQCKKNPIDKKDTKDYCVILPGEQKPITVKLLAPTTTQIAGLNTKLRASFRVEYVYAGSTLQDVLVVKMDEILARMRQGEPISLKKTDTHGSGPVQIGIGIKGAEYILPGQDATFEFIIKSKGDKAQGGVQESRIGPRGFSITFPRSMFGTGTKIMPPGDENGIRVAAGNDLNCNCINSQRCSDNDKEYELVAGYKEKSGPVTDTNPCITNEERNKGNCPNGIVEKDRNGNVCMSDENREKRQMLFYCAPEGVCWNVKSIELFKGESTPLLFVISGIKDIQEPYRTFTIRSNIEYTYELRNSIDITVNPFTNV